jgi:hypothetical protein
MKSVQGMTLVFVGAAMAACSAASDGSVVKHDFGATRREPEGNLATCAEQPSEFPLALDYLKALADRIMKANPETFQGPYAPDRFCFAVVEGDSVNAFAASQERSVTFLSKLLETAESDATVAGVLAHELSHVTMQHGTTIHPLLAQSDEWKAARAAADQEAARLNREAAALFKEKDGTFVRMNELRDAITASLPQELKLALDGIVKDGQELQRDAFGIVVADEDAGRQVRQVLNSGLGSLLLGSTGIPAAPTDAQPTAAAIADFKARLSAFAQSLKTWQEAVEGRDGERMHELLALQASSDALSERLIASLEASAGAFEPVNALEAKILGAEERANWQEREADEVGLELYLRAGFDAFSFSYIDRQLMSAEALTGCRAQIAAGGADVARGNGDHPAHCWRVLDTEVLEPTKHADDYRELLPQAKTVEALPGRLAEVKAELARGPTPTAEP